MSSAVMASGLILALALPAVGEAKGRPVRQPAPAAGQGAVTLFTPAVLRSLTTPPARPAPLKA